MDAHFSIIFQGLYKDSYLPVLLNAKLYSDDVIVSTWLGSINEKEIEKLNTNGIKVVQCQDPGTIDSYEEFSEKKQLNISRMLHGLREGLLIAKHIYAFKCRMDISINFQKFFSIYQKSEKEYGVLNVTSVCPGRLGSPKFLFHLSDWCFCFEKDKFLKRRPLNSDDYFLLPTPKKFSDTTWFTRLRAEQILTLYICDQFDLLQNWTNDPKHNQIEVGGYAIHKRILYRFTNVARERVDFKSHFYTARSTAWLMYDSPNFEDEYFLKLSPVQFLYFFLANIFRMLRIRYGARR